MKVHKGINKKTNETKKNIQMSIENQVILGDLQIKKNDVLKRMNELDRIKENFSKTKYFSPKSRKINTPDIGNPKNINEKMRNNRSIYIANFDSDEKSETNEIKKNFTTFGNKNYCYNSIETLKMDFEIPFERNQKHNGTLKNDIFLKKLHSSQKKESISRKNLNYSNTKASSAFSEEIIHEKYLMLRDQNNSIMTHLSQIDSKLANNDKTLTLLYSVIEAQNNSFIEEIVKLKKKLCEFNEVITQVNNENKWFINQNRMLKTEFIKVIIEIAKREVINNESYMDITKDIQMLIEENKYLRLINSNFSEWKKFDNYEKSENETENLYIDNESNLNYENIIQETTVKNRNNIQQEEKELINGDDEMNESTFKIFNKLKEKENEDFENPDNLKTMSLDYVSVSPNKNLFPLKNNMSPLKLTYHKK